jgi:regulator of protease activity HflC (stomatin/prohibitin superfamily)
MKGDAQSYGRAVGVSILGLILQGVFTVLLASYAGLSKGDHAAVTAAWHIGLGLLVWAPLIVLFDLHRRERREAVEIERLAQEESTSVFEGVEQPRAARTLEAMRKFALPAIGLIIGGSLLTLGIVRLRGLGAGAGFDGETQTVNKGFAIAAGLAVAVIAFVFARFVSGMATQRVWGSLRAGASYAVGTALLGLTVAVTQFIDSTAGRTVALDPVAHAVPIFSLVMGAEMLLNVVLDVYRPRKPGEDPRPAFDSRLLGLLAAPDKIAENIGEALNYQFGVEVSKSWFYLLLQRWWPGLVAVALLVTWGMTSLVVIEPHQRALVLTFGKPSAPLVSFGDREGDEVGPGLHIVAPWPMTEVYIPVSRTKDKDGKTVETRTSTGVRSFTLGTNPPDPAKAVLWTNEHTLEEVFSLVQPAPLRSGATAGEGSAGRVADLSLVAVEAPVQYVVSDVRLYDELAQPDHRDLLLRALGQRVLMHQLSSMNIDEVLGAGRTALAVDLRERLEATYSRTGGEGGGAGIRLTHVGSGSVHPPKDAAYSFERVVQAQQVMQSKIESAMQDQIRILTEVAPPIEREDGSLVTASDIVAMLDGLTAMRGSGASPDEVIERELAVQRLLEEAGGGAGAALIEASAQRWATHMGERGRAALFQGQLTGYRAAPALYRSKLYFDALAEAMRDSRVFLTGEKLTDLRIILELQTRDTAIDVFDPEAGSEAQP